MLPVAAQGPEASPKAGTNRDFPRHDAWVSDPWERSPPPVWRLGGQESWRAGRLPGRPVPAITHWLKSITSDPRYPITSLDPGQLCPQKAIASKKSLLVKLRPQREQQGWGCRQPWPTLGRPPSAAFPKTWPQSLPPWRRVEMAICSPSSGEQWS